MINSITELRTSVSLKVAVIGLLVLLLLIPVAMIRGVIDDREAVSAQAQSDIMRAWGGQQEIGGPILVLPYDTVRTTQYGERINMTGQLQILPAILNVDVELDSEMRHRGLHEVPVYTAKTLISASFAVPDWSGLGIDNAEIHWDRAVIAISISDARATRNAPYLEIDDTRVRFEPAGSRIAQLPPQITAPVSFYRNEDNRDAALAVSIAFDTSGTRSFSVQALGDETVVNMRSNWPDPSFFGAFLPEAHDVTDTGFTAGWRATSLGRTLPARWLDGALQQAVIETAVLGVELFVPVGLYQLADRATKYAIMFIGLTFVAYFLFEVLGGLRLHPLQYLLVGFGNAIFFVLLLSLAEHIGFGLAYLLSATASAGMITGYSLSILRDRGRALLMLGILSLLYGFLYLTLQAETYAMLAGSIGLWSSLALIMYLTRRIDWYLIGQRRESQQEMTL
jgi:inner membrane protein